MGKVDVHSVIYGEGTRGLYDAREMRYSRKHCSNAPACSHSEYLKDVEEAKALEQRVRDVKGSSKVSEVLPHFDAIWGFPSEYVHGVLLSVTKQLRVKLM